ncbi:right-handed parallel beta-helix repeat-containing protein [Salsipaludibacter albus]|uniref:right-handed parallel beta-helix repeat-containing protein n=1 Tax=Salsipaludibacter albus TaxID=2849650 RepID=UPI001EE45275|nr:right-handed parallel beta-helix repeat-containing protein [Salsipaludibacter albus]MBY5161790.1 right-handed parallel beta-helix repeat-containing protein [Salsipaludibacter albus]
MRTARALGALLLVAATLGACDGGTTATPTTSPSPSGSPEVLGPEPLAAEPTDCPMLATRIVDALQDWVDSFPTTTEPGEAPTATPDTDLPTLAGELAPLAADLGCDRDTMAPLVADALADLTAEGALQEAVADTLKADPLGSLDPSDPDAEVRPVTTGEELVTAIAEVGSGSTIELPDGPVDVDEPLVLLRPITITGTASSVVRSSADGAAFILSADGDVTLEQFEVVNLADAASGVVVSAGGFQLTDLVLRGARANASGAGGFGVVVLPSRGGLVRGGELATVERVRVEDATGGGVVLGGSSDPRVVDVTVVGPQDERVGCGLCWIGAASGTVVDATVTGWQVGLRIDEQASPVVEGGTVDDNAVGITMGGTGAPEIDGTTLAGNDTGVEAAGTVGGSLVGLVVTDARDVGVRITAGATPLVEDLEVGGSSSAGLAVVDDAAPDVRGGDLTIDGEVAAIWGGRATGSATGLAVHGSRIGLQVGDRAAPSLTDLTATDVGDVAMIATETAGGSLDGLVCDEDERGTVVLVEGAELDVRDAGDCEVVEQAVEEG